MDPLMIREDALTVIQKRLSAALQEFGDEVNKENKLAEVEDVEKKRTSEKIAKRLKLTEKIIIDQIKAGAVVVESSQRNPDVKIIIHPLGKVDENIPMAISDHHLAQSSDSEEAALRQEVDKLQAEVNRLSVKVAERRQTARKEFLNLAQEAVQQQRPIPLGYLTACQTDGDSQLDECDDKKIEDRLASFRPKNSSLLERVNSALSRLGRVLEVVEGRQGQSQLIEEVFSEHLQENLP